MPGDLTQWPMPADLPSAPADYDSVLEEIGRCATEEERRQYFRWFCLNDLYFLIRIVGDRADFEHTWLFDRCREFQANPNGHLDLWARDHRKSTIITFWGTIQEVLRNPEITCCVLSFNRPTAKAFLSQIKDEFEQNELLRWAFPDVLYVQPDRDSPKWSLDDGLRVRRKLNPKENTIEAGGLIDGMPTGKHYDLLVYDDVVTPDCVASPEMMLKVTDRWKVSLALGAGETTRFRYIGTRYHPNDPYAAISQSAEPRIHACREDGVPVLFSNAFLEKRQKDMGHYIFACQMMQNPMAMGNQNFKPEWLKYYPVDDEDYRYELAEECNLYLLVDPAGSKKKRADYTSIALLGLHHDQSIYLLDGLRDRLNLSERTDAVFAMHRKWSEFSPVKTGYEAVGKDSDAEHIEIEMKSRKYRFHIIVIRPRTAKEDRIRKLEPYFSAGRFILPEKLVKTSVTGQEYDLTALFRDEEYLFFPTCKHDDVFDNFAQIVDPSLGAMFPKRKKKDAEPGKAVDAYRDKKRREGAGRTWMSA